MDQPGRQTQGRHKPTIAIKLPVNYYFQKYEGGGGAADEDVRWAVHMHKTISGSRPSAPHCLAIFAASRASTAGRATNMLAAR